MVAAHRRRQQRDRKGKRNAFSYRGHRFNDDDVDAYLKRRMEYDYRKGVGPPSPTLAAIDGLMCWSPTPDPPEIPALALVPSSQFSARSVPRPRQGFDSEVSYRSSSSSPCRDISTPRATNTTEELTENELAPLREDGPTLIVESLGDSSDTACSLPQMDLAHFTGQKLGRHSRRRTVSINIRKVLLPTSPETTTESILYTLTSLYTSYFESGQWFSTNLQEPCRCVGFNCPPSLSTRLTMREINGLLVDCFWNSRENKVTHAVAYLNRACEVVKDTLIKNEPGLIGRLLQSMLLYQHSRGAARLRRSFLEYFGNCASIVHGNASHPFVQWANFMIRHGDDRAITRALLELNQQLLERFLSPSHWTSIMARYDTLVTLGEATPASAWEAFLSDVRTFLGEDVWVHTAASNRLGQCYLALNRFADVETLYATLISDLASGVAKPCCGALKGAWRLSQAQFALGKDAQAFESIRIALQATFSAASAGTLAVQDVKAYIETFAYLLHEKDRLEEARELFAKLRVLEREEQTLVERELAKLR